MAPHADMNNHSAGATGVIKALHLVTLSNQTDRFYALSPLFIWAAGENALAIVAATIPTLRPLLGTKKNIHNTDANSASWELGNVHAQTPIEMFYPRARRAALTTIIESRGYGERNDGQSDESFLERGKQGENELLKSEDGAPTKQGKILATTQICMVSTGV